MSGVCALIPSGSVHKTEKETAGDNENETTKRFPEINLTVVKEIEHIRKETISRTTSELGVTLEVFHTLIILIIFTYIPFLGSTSTFKTIFLLLNAVCPAAASFLTPSEKATL